MRTAQAALASRLDDTNTPKNVMDRPIVVTPARCMTRIDKFGGQPVKPGDAITHEWVAGARRNFTAVAGGK